MLCYVITCITAFMFIFGRNFVHTVNMQPNFLQEVADFDSIIEPELDGNVIQTRESEYDEETDLDCPTHNRDLNGVKRELSKMGNLFVNEFFGDDHQESLRRWDREDDEHGEESYEDESGENNETKSEDEKAMKAKNMTQHIKNLYTQIENPNATEEEEEGPCQPVAEEEGAKKSLVHQSPKKHKPHAADDLLEMHFYKYLPESGSIKLKPENEKLVSINLYPETAKGHSVFPAPKKYDYIALMSKDKSLVRVPAVKFTVVSDEDDLEREKRNSYKPFSVSRYKRRATKSAKLKRFRNGLKVIGGDRLRYQNLTHVPILFVNTIPHMPRIFRGTNRLHKRLANFDVSENKYLREADLLIQNVNTSLRMGMGESKRTTKVDAGVLINSKRETATPT